MKPFIRQEDASNRLNNTVCFYKGKPVYVTVSVDFPTNDIHIVDFGAMVSGRKTTPKIINVTDKEFDPFPRPLGYINYVGYAVYVGRLPERRPKQGLSMDAICVVNENPGGWNGRTLFNTEDFYNMLINKYPSFQEALASLDDGNTSCAFHRECAISYIARTRSVGLIYRGRMIGLYNRTKGIFQFLPETRDASYLMPVLGSYGIHIV